MALFLKTGITTVFVNLEGWPEDWKTNLPAVIKFFRDHQRPSFLEYGEYPYVTRRRGQEGAAAEGRVFRDARRNAVTASRRARVRRHPAHPARLVSPALTGRYEFLSFRDAAQRAALAVGNPREGRTRRRQPRKSRRPDARWVTVAFTWNGLRALGVDERVAGHVSRGVPARHGRARGDPRRHRRQPSGPLGGRTRKPGPPRHRDPVRPRRRQSASGAVREHQRCSPRVPASRCSRRSIWRPSRRSTTRTITSATATGSRSRPSRAPARRRRPGSGAPLKAGEFILGYPDEDGPPARLPEPEVLSRNGSYMAYRRLRGARRRVSRFPEAARQDGRTNRSSSRPS